MSDEDFPAAHSMDTQWYAVDKDGNLAHFSTGEAGSAPSSAMNSADPDSSFDVAKIVTELPSDCAVNYEVDDLVAMVGGPVFDFSWHSRQYESASFSDAASCYCVLMLLASEAKLNELREKALIKRRAAWGRNESVKSIARIVNSKHILAYMDGPLPVGTLQSWVQDQLILKAWVNHPLSASRIGIFEYDHGEVFENWISGLYLRDGVPANPLNVRDLPPSLRIFFESTRFAKRSFAKDSAIDPREAGECISWEPSWVGLDGIMNRVENDTDY